MRKTITDEFGKQRPVALILDDNAPARRMTARALHRRGFEVMECADAEEFHASWRPGTVDVIVSDWALSHRPDENGDAVLASVRKKDWDVPFVLISGQLGDASERAEVLERLLDKGNARFVVRGASGIDDACEAAEDLIERRDLALLKIVLAIRPAALADELAVTSSGTVSARDALAELVSKPAKSHDAGRPIAATRSKRAAASE